jgi:hypothetical protein
MKKRGRSSERLEEIASIIIYRDHVIGNRQCVCDLEIALRYNVGRPAIHYIKQTIPRELLFTRKKRDNHRTGPARNKKGSRNPERLKEIASLIIYREYVIGNRKAVCDSEISRRYGVTRSCIKFIKHQIPKDLLNG